MSRQRLRAEDGFGLVELLVVVLIIGILVTVALPSLLGQRKRAQDANAKTVAVTAAKAATAYGTDDGVFDALDPAALIKIEPSLESANGLKAEGTGRTFTVSVDSAAGTTFSIERTADGELTRDCTRPGSEGCRATPDARGNRW